MSQQNPPPGQPNPYGNPYGQPTPAHQPPANGPGPYGGPPQGPGLPSTVPPADHGDNRVGFFKALFDVGFTSYATPSVVKIIFVLTIIFGVLTWLGTAVFILANGHSGVVGALLPIFLGWLPILIWITLVRVGLELALSSVRTAENTRKIRENYGL